jgi:hypothetical protein
LTTLLAVVAIALVVLLAWLVMRSRAKNDRPDSRPADNLDTVAAWPPQATRVLTSVERDAFDRLRAALPAHTILAQVPLARFIKVPTRASYAEWLRRVGHLCADFVICDRHSQVIAVVEVHAGGDATSARVQKRQQRLARVLKAAGIPVHVWIENALPTIDAAREAIAPTPPPSVTPTVAPSSPSAMTRSAPGRPVAPSVNPFNDEERDTSADEIIEVREAPPSTWFDDFDTAPAPLAPDKPKPQGPR